MRWLPAALLLVLSSAAMAQNVTGKVTDSEDNNPLPGANILIKGTAIGTTTDANGEFSLQVEDANTVLVVSFIGYTSQKFGALM